ncbi:hypothetical protein LTR70_005349 [Exophiala xenobiotica]|uniref:Uncharacterized protein n=1 Tax=Lithohypha guttulata TaxID=1690604 RepID=A0ABR0K5C9_9EURO|nr:hypothetical protein LTR24_006679 [Lithohypha guttulata]KAK5318784.1 hypothetical protein LTR70_005349 [Exophiala xenobiotica]
MVLVGYSDSEGSDTEPTPVPTTKPVQPAKPTTTTNFAVDKSNPKKIRVNLTEPVAPTASTDDIDGEPPTKRARVGAGAFSGFNAMLPAPKRDNLTTSSASANTNGTKVPARKVFSLKTGAEPAFSRDSDSELRELFADDGARQTEESTIPTSIPKPAFTTEKQQSTGPASEVGGGKPFMFKPLSVARNTKKKSSASTLATPVASTTRADQTSIQPSAALQEPPDQRELVPRPATKKEKISLFSSGPAALPPDPDDLPANDGLNPDASNEDEILELLDDDDQPTPYTTTSTNAPQPPNEPESLSSIATSLNLSAAERRQLLGRSHNPGSSKNPNTTTANRIINFNTDAEYIANQQMNAAGEQAQLQHNPVRAIAPGKHSLKSLVASAQGQKDALEESFASGKKNKREAGSKYGW